MPDLPDGLTEEKLKDGIVKFSTDEPSGGDVEPGATVSGEVTGTDVREVEFNDETIYYFEVDIQIDDAFEITESISLNGGELNQGTQFGYITNRFLDDPDEFDDEELDLSEVYEGTRVEFEVDESDEGFTEVASDEDDVSTLRPEGTELDAAVDTSDSSDDSEGSDDSSEESSESDDSGSDDDGPDAEFAEAVEDLIGEEESEVKKQLAKQSGKFVKEHKSAVGDGSIEYEDGVLVDVDL